jgi:hypothetical protein
LLFPKKTFESASGVSPDIFLIEKSTFPIPKSNFTVSKWPPQQAKCNGVSPSLFYYLALVNAIPDN